MHNWHNLISLIILCHVYENISQFLSEYSNPLINILEIYHGYQNCVTQELGCMGNKE
jgi:hypothetical protein